MVNDKDFASDSFGDYNDDSYSLDHKPQEMGFDTFKLRNDPEHLLKTIKYHLMQVEEFIDSNNKIKLVPKKNPITGEEVKPLINQQGVEEIMLVLHPIINNHNVMGNMSSEKVLDKTMKGISDDLTVYLWSMQEDWKLNRNHVNPLILFLSNQMYLFLSRTVGDLERMHYGESFKETREVKPMVQEKKNFLSNMIPGMFKR